MLSVQEPNKVPEPPVPLAGRAYPLETRRAVSLVTKGYFSGGDVTLASAADDGRAYVAEGNCSTWNAYHPLGSALQGAGTLQGDILDLSKGDTAYGAVTGDGHVWGTFRQNGSWKPWVNLEIATRFQIPISYEADVGTFGMDGRPETSTRPFACLMPSTCRRIPRTGQRCLPDPRRRRPSPPGRCWPVP